MVSAEQAEVVLLIAAGSALLLGLWTWSSTSVDTISENSGSKKNRTLECAEIDLEYISFTREGNGTEITFQTNRELESVSFYSSEKPGVNVTVRNVSARALQEVSTTFLEPEDVYARIPGCRRTFR